MAFTRLLSSTLIIRNNCLKCINYNKNINRFIVTRSKYKGIISPEPHRTSYGLIKIVLIVVPGLLIGAGISKSIANFLEENELFVPSDDDDDDDDD